MHLLLTLGAGKCMCDNGYIYTQCRGTDPREAQCIEFVQRSTLGNFNEWNRREVIRPLSITAIPFSNRYETQPDLSLARVGQSPLEQERWIVGVTSPLHSQSR